MPGDHVERRMIDRANEKIACQLGYELEISFPILECRYRRLEVAAVRQAIAADRAPLR